MNQRRIESASLASLKSLLNVQSKCGRKESFKIEGVLIFVIPLPSALIDDVEHVFFAYAVFLGK
jgi:hypothetical protein